MRGSHLADSVRQGDADAVGVVAPALPVLQLQKHPPELPGAAEARQHPKRQLMLLKAVHLERRMRVLAKRRLVDAALAVVAAEEPEALAVVRSAAGVDRFRVAVVEESPTRIA
jgi:hypothetical protein